MTNEQITNLIGGHLDLTQALFDEYYRHQIDNALAKNQSFVVGDAVLCRYVSTAIFFGKTKAVVVYHMFESPRFGMRDFQLAEDFKVMQNAMNK